jgi:enamine deaminase RidA (YjgF/YER057c/UK114 family)
MGKQAIGGGFTGPGGMKLPFPKAVRAGDFVFVSGQMATDANGQLVDGGIEVQTRQIMDNIKAILAEAGCTMADVVKCTCWIDDPRDFGRFNASTANTSETIHRPARPCARNWCWTASSRSRRSPTSRRERGRERRWLGALSPSHVSRYKTTRSASKSSRQGEPP